MSCIQTSTGLVLASSSPRRKMLLEQVGYEFVCLSPDVDERRLALVGNGGDSLEPPHTYVERLAVDKAHAGSELWLKSDSVQTHGITLQLTLR